MSLECATPICVVTPVRPLGPGISPVCGIVSVVSSGLLVALGFGNSRPEVLPVVVLRPALMRCSVKEKKMENFGCHLGRSRGGWRAARSRRSCPMIAQIYPANCRSCPEVLALAEDGGQRVDDGKTRV
ncbi:hypothetical protein Dimus_035757 [Dionaea muscipula]